MSNWVIKGFDEYYYRVCENDLEEIRDLRQATTFKTKKVATAIINETSFSEYLKVVKFSDEIDAFMDWLSSGMLRRTIPFVNRAYSRKYDNDDLETVIAFHKFHKSNEREVAYEDYRTWPDINKFCNCFYRTEVYRDEDYNLQFTFKIMLHKQKSTFEEFKKQFDILEPHVDFVSEDGKYKIFSIFDHGLSEFDTYYFHYNIEDESKCQVVSSRYGIDVKCEGSLKKCFDYMKNYHYYESSDNCED